MEKKEMVRKQTTLTPAVRPYDDAATSRADETPRCANAQSCFPD